MWQEIAYLDVKCTKYINKRLATSVTRFRVVDDQNQPHTFLPNLPTTFERCLYG